MTLLVRSGTDPDLSRRAFDEDAWGPLVMEDIAARRRDPAEFQSRPKQGAVARRGLDFSSTSPLGEFDVAFVEKFGLPEFRCGVGPVQ